MKELKLFLASYGGAYNRPEMMVWHPVFTRNWLSHEKVYNYIHRDTSIPVDQLYTECAKIKYIADYPKPNVRGFMLVSINGSKSLKKWVVLFGSKIYICGTNTIQRTDLQVPIMDVAFKIVEKHPSKDIYINA
jgi:hypothetical protein